MACESVLILCTGNICRSPMAEAVLRRMLAAGGHDVAVASAGLGALIEHPADILALELMRERHLDLSGHRGRQVTTGMLESADLVLVMDSVQQRLVEKRWPGTRGKVHRLGRWSAFDIPDPFGQPRESFEVALGLIERGVAEWWRREWSSGGT